MVLVKKLLLIPCLFVCTFMARAQNVKPMFKELTVVAYVPNDSAKTLALTMNMYYHINSSGMIHFIMNNMDPKHFYRKDVRFSGLVSDTTYQLADKVIDDLNKVFNGEKTLSSYKIRPKPTTGTSLLARGEFISYVARNGTCDKIIAGDDTFGADINLVLGRIYSARMARTEKHIGIYHDKALEAEILKDHIACNCIPEAEAPPTVEHLQIKQ